jgi:hypothetical protein
MEGLSKILTRGGERYAASKHHDEPAKIGHSRGQCSAVPANVSPIRRRASATVDPGAGNFFLRRDGYTAALPMSSPTRNNTKKTKNKTRAIPSAVPAMPPNPRTPATIATIKKIMPSEA